MSDPVLRFIGWCILSPKGLFLHGLGEEYFSRAKWVGFEDEPTFYAGKSVAESMIAQLVLLDAALIGAIHTEEAWRLGSGDYVLKTFVRLVVENGLFRTELVNMGRLDKKV